MRRKTKKLIKIALQKQRESMLEERKAYDELICIHLQEHLKYITGGKMGSKRTFNLVRTEDVTGVSGTGVVAEGTEYSNGKCTLTWLTEHSSVAVYDNIEDLKNIHCHHNASYVEYVNSCSHEWHNE